MSSVHEFKPSKELFIELVQVKLQSTIILMSQFVLTKHCMQFTKTRIIGSILPIGSLYDAYSSSQSLVENM